jgi:hypothetical protein
VVGVPQNNLRIQLAEFAGANAFHAPLRSHSHERGRIDHAMRSCQSTASRFGVPILCEYAEHPREFSLGTTASTLTLIVFDVEFADFDYCVR